MKLLDILDQDHIKADITSKGKREVLEELSEIVSTREGLDLKELVSVLEEREKLGSTGIGNGIAIPHGKLKGLKKLVASFGRSVKGVDFESIDGKPTHLFFLLIAPENTAGIHLKALARISRLLKDKKFRDDLLRAKTSEDIFKIIKEEDDKF
jgi:PTS system nitrogen regulatory IIA component